MRLTLIIIILMLVSNKIRSDDDVNLISESALDDAGHECLFRVAGGEPLDGSGQQRRNQHPQVCIY